MGDGLVVMPRTGGLPGGREAWPDPRGEIEVRRS